MKKVLIVGSSKLPVPAVKGGAVPNLIEELIQQHEVENKINLTCCSLWDENAELQSRKYSKTEFIWAKVPSCLNYMDKLLRVMVKHVLRKDRLLSISFVFQVIWYTLFLANILRKNTYDRVVFENSVPMLFALKLYRNNIKYKSKYDIHMHSVPRKYYGNEKVFEHCRKLICVSQYVADSILYDKRVNMCKQKVCIMYNCIDTAHIKPLSKVEIDNVKSIYNIDKDKKIILFVGRLCSDKGIEELIKAVALLNNKKIKLMVVGSNFYSSGIVSNYEQKLITLSEPVKDKIIFTGYVDYTDMVKIYNIADVVVLPSIWDEPAGMTIIEAMACRKPVITTVSGGIPEYTGTDSCILINRDRNIVNNISENIAKIISDIGYASIIGEKSFYRAIRYNKQYYYEQFLKIVNGE